MATEKLLALAQRHFVLQLAHVAGRETVAVGQRSGALAPPPGLREEVFRRGEELAQALREAHPTQAISGPSSLDPIRKGLDRCPG